MSLLFNYFTQLEKGFVLTLLYNGSNSFLFVNATKVYQFKAKDSEMKNYTPWLGTPYIKELYICIYVYIYIDRYIYT